MAEEAVRWKAVEAAMLQVVAVLQAVAHQSEAAVGPRCMHMDLGWEGCERYSVESLLAVLSPAL